MQKASLYLVSLCLLMAGMLASVNSYANHILAMDLYYSWVSGNTYKITMVIYGDCGPNSNTSTAFQLLSTASPAICVFKGNNNITTINLQVENGGLGVDVTPVCPNQVGHTQCEDPNSSIPGISRFVYSTLFTLPTPATGIWSFAHFGDLGNSQAGRSAAVTNIANPGNSAIQIVDTLDNTAGGHNSNASFSVIPTPFFCLNNSDSYNPGAIDPDHDSLNVIDLVPAMEGQLACQFGGPATYVGTAWNPPFTPISAQTPLSVIAGSYTYNATTGQLNFIPNVTQRSTVVYNVREYRNGHFVGSSQREMNFLVQTCNATPPTGGISTVSNGIKVDSAHFIGCHNTGPFSFTFDPHEDNALNHIKVDTAGVPTGYVVNVTNNNTANPHVVVSGTTTGVTPGTHIFYLTYTDDNCPLQGTNTTAISVTIYPSSSVTYSVTAPITCAPKEAITIMPSGDGSPWTIKVTGTSSQTFNNVTGSFIDSLAPGTYTIDITAPGDTSICNNHATVVVQASDITGDTVVCAQSSIMLSDPIAGGAWVSSDPGVATVIATGVGAGTVTGVTSGVATISYFFPGGCYKTSPIHVNPQPPAITGNMHVCDGFTTILSDALAGGVWTSGNTATATVGVSNGAVTGISPGTALITYTAIGCPVATTVTVDVQPQVLSGSPNICTDGTTVLTVTPGGGTWSNTNSSVATITVTSPTTATISGIVDGTTVISYALQSCIVSKTINAVSILPAITGPNKVCTGQSITLSDVIVGGTWASTITTIATVDVDSGTVVGVTAGVTHISYTIGGSCIAVASVTVNQSPDHGVITGPANVCTSDTIRLSDAITGGTWAVSNANAQITTTGLVNGIAPGGDTVWYIVHNALCRDTATRPVTIYPRPVPGDIIGPPVLCVGSIVALSDTAAGGVWTALQPTIGPVSTTGILTGVSAGTDTVVYTLSNPGCAISAILIVGIYDHPAAGTITGRPQVCAGAVFVLSDEVSGGVWTSSNSSVATMTGSKDTVYAVSAGTTIISYTTGPNAGGCYGFAQHPLTILPEGTLVINRTLTQISCNGANDGRIDVTVSGSAGALQYLWSNGATTSSISSLTPATYTLAVSDPTTLCEAAGSYQVTEPAILRVVMDTTQDVCKTGSGVVNPQVTGGTTPYQYLWQDNSTGSKLEHLHAGTYSVTVTDAHNCKDSEQAEVTDNDCVITVYNALTPNGDGINDTWVIEGITNYPDNTVQVFDKWGDKVYEKTNYANDWAGRGKNGSLVPDGTYYYVVKLNNINLLGGESTFTGTIFIKR